MKISKMKSKIYIYVSFFVFSIKFYTLSALPNELGAYVMGLSHHIGANKSRPAYEDAPLGLDKYGKFVYNPGLGLTIDYFRLESENSKHVLSGLPLLITFFDCDLRPAYILGAGPRYRFYPVTWFSIDTDLFLSLYRAQDWETSIYINEFMPYYSLGINYHFAKLSLGMKTTYAKRGTATSISEFNIFFSYIYIGLRF